MRAKISAICATGVAIKTRSASRTSRAASSPMRSRMWSFMACSSVAALRPKPTTSSTAFALRRASANEPPTNPTPKMTIFLNWGLVITCYLNFYVTPRNRLQSPPGLKCTSDRLGNPAQRTHQILQFLRSQCLIGVAPGLARIRMHFHQQTVRTCGDGGLRERRHHPRLASCMRWVNDHRQVRFLFQYRNRGHIQHVAIVSLKSADAAFAENDVVVAARRNVFRRHQPFRDGGRHAALEYHRLVDAPDFFEQIKVLHVACANLDYIHVVFHEGIEHTDIHQFGDDGQFILACRSAEHVQSLHALALKRIRTGARLERTAAHQTAPRFMDKLCREIHLLLGFHRTRPANHLYLVAAKPDSANVDDTIFAMRFARYDFVLLGNVHCRFHTRHGSEHFFGQWTLITDRADYGALDAARNIGLQPGIVEFFYYGSDLRIRYIAVHHYDHTASTKACCNADKNFSFSVSKPMLTRK